LRNKGRAGRIFSATKTNNVLEILIYSEIGEDWNGNGVSPKTVQDAMKAAGNFNRVVVRLNSPGGSSFDGVAIHNMLRQQKVPVDVIVEGLAASAAFTIAMAGDTIRVCDGTMMMLHNAWSIALGDATELRRVGALLDQVSGTLRDIYVKRSGLGVAEITSMMTAETWLTPEDAVKNGFATERLSTTPAKARAAAAIAAHYDLAKFCRRKPAELKKENRAFREWSEDLERRSRLRVAELQ
jgi:ATP-dependent Clp protease protease subunit